jgi:hypothetical protein
MATLQSYDLNGKKLSFANWISNLSPEETPFTSMTGKETVSQTLFQWQNDSLIKAGRNAVKEGDEAIDASLRSTTVRSNVTQILRKTVKVSDTANALANYGRGKELQYQMEKAGKEIKRDIEWAFLHNGNSQQEHTDTVGTRIPRETAGFLGLVSPIGTADIDTGAMVHKSVKTTGTLTEDDIFDLTYNLYLSGSKASIIMFHPKHASLFSSLQEKSDGTRERMFHNTPKISVYVSTLVDPLGQEYKLIPNRWMPEGHVFFFNPSDWTQMVLRPPERTKLAKDGSYEKWMIEMEVGLRLRHPFAAGVLDIDSSDDPVYDNAWEKATFDYIKPGTSAVVNMDIKKKEHFHVDVKRGSQISFDRKTKATIPDPAAAVKATHTIIATDMTVLVMNGHEAGRWTEKGDTVRATGFVITHGATSQHSGDYYISYQDKSGVELARTGTVTVSVV